MLDEVELYGKTETGVEAVEGHDEERLWRNSMTAI